MYKFLPIFLLLALTGCSSSPEDQLKACVIGGSKMFVDNMKADPVMGENWTEKNQANFDKELEKIEAMSWEEMIGDSDDNFIAKACLDHQKNNPELFQEMVSY